jgi:hypothetical protein
MPFNLWDWLSGAVDDLLEAGEDAWDFVKNPAYVLARDSAKAYASAYNLRGDGEAFEELWGLTVNAMLFAHEAHEDAIDEVVRELRLLDDLVDAAPRSPTAFGRPVSVLGDDGFRELQVAGTAGRYVIFSDHHMLFSGCRQNFFRDGSREGSGDGNIGLYLQVLEEYYAEREYTLVENGDVEELIILEPDLREIDDIQGWSWAEVKAYREARKLPQLRAIARDNRDYYETIQRGFIADRRYLRLTGNHDRDMRSQRFADAVSEVAGIEMPLASDALILRDGDRVDFIVCHGHQFDTACTPRFAAELGESFSQASAWAYQGPDRVWRASYDPIDEWLSGERSFANALVDDEPAVADNWDVPLVGKTPAEILAVLNTSLPEWIADSIGTLETRKQWENIYDKNIAWEYFDHANAGDAIDHEVKTGRRWFKFRHLNELRIVDELRRAFPGRTPTLVLGHSHEPRLRSGRRGDAHGADCYLNSASAGRFEGLIWGLELIDGEPLLISWHRDGSTPVRTVWRDAREGDAFVLRPDATATIDELLAAGAEPDPRERMALYIAIDQAVR